VQPSRLALRLARDRVAACRAPVEIDGLDGQSLPFADHSVDAVLCTWTLWRFPTLSRLFARFDACCVRAARHFVEHGAAPDVGVRRWQDHNGLQRRVGCGCNLNRDIPALIEADGLSISRLDTYYCPGQLKPMAATSKVSPRPLESAPDQAPAR
jgi:hypothetical protein